MALKPVNAEGYLLARTAIVAGSAAWDKWAADGGVPLQGPAFPNLDPSAKYLAEQIFQYIPRMTIVIDADPGADNCPTEEQRVDGACFVMRYDVVFDPLNRQRMLDALNARTPPEILAVVQNVEANNPKAPDVSVLEWWVVLVTSIAVAFVSAGIVPALGTLAAVLKIAGYILASYAALNIIALQTPEGKSIFDKFSARLADGFAALLSGAKMAGQIAIGVGVVAVLWAIFGRGR